MDHRLVAWARGVKTRHRHNSGRALPVLWLFTDQQRLPDPREAVARLPRGLCGVVLRHDGVADRERLGTDVAAICRKRRLALVVAGDPRLALALRAGMHIRGGRQPLAGSRTARRRGAVITASAHGRADLIRAARSGCHLAFLSPAFPTDSHPGARALGARRWNGLTLRTKIPILALGGVTGGSVRGLSRHGCRGAGAIAALA